MRWELVSNKSAALHEYHLMDNDICKVVLKYNPLHRSVRVSSSGNQRLFYIESAGVLTGKKIFKNEYGMEIGSMVAEKLNDHDGTISIENKKYHYHLQNNSLAELVIYNNNGQLPLATCDFKTTDNVLSNINGIDNSCLLLGLCWYLYLPVARENRVEYAA